METLIALLLISTPNGQAKFKANHCYSSDSEFRPNIIKIDAVGTKEYLYSFYIKPASSPGYYTVDLDNSISTIEEVYSKEVKCPESM